jgi:hypothetical protein
VAFIVLVCVVAQVISFTSKSQRMNQSCAFTYKPDTGSEIDETAEDA